MQASSWHLMQDGVVFFNVNHQGSPRGGDELAVQNWWMGMAERSAGSGRLRFTLMLSLEPATLGNDGYREIFQVGETLDGLPLIDRQHPHDFLMQAAVVWRTPLGRGYSLTLAGAPVGEPALGPVAFMHRASAFENPTAPLAHHTFDSTHIAMGVLTAGVDRGRWQAEAPSFTAVSRTSSAGISWIPGALDSWSVRGWYRPTSTLDAAGVARLSEDSRSARARRRQAHDGLGVLAAHAARRLDGRDRRLRTQQQDRWRLQRVPRRGHHIASAPTVCMDASSRCRWRATCCASAGIPSSAARRSSRTSTYRKAARDATSSAR